MRFKILTTFGEDFKQLFFVVRIECAHNIKIKETDIKYNFVNKLITN